MNLEYKEKYLKYKTKYLNLVGLVGGERSYCKNYGETPITKKISCRKSTEISAHDKECERKNGKCRSKKSHEEKILSKPQEEKKFSSGVEAFMKRSKKLKSDSTNSQTLSKQEYTQKVDQALKNYKPEDSILQDNINKLDSVEVKSSDNLLSLIKKVYTKNTTLLETLMKNPDKSHLSKLKNAHKTIAIIIDKIGKAHENNVINTDLAVNWTTKYENLNSEFNKYIDMLEKPSQISKKDIKGKCNTDGISCIFSKKGSEKHCNKQLGDKDSEECECLDSRKTGNYRCHVKKPQKKDDSEDDSEDDSDDDTKLNIFDKVLKKKNKKTKAKVEGTCDVSGNYCIDTETTLKNPGCKVGNKETGIKSEICKCIEESDNKHRCRQPSAKEFKEGYIYNDKYDRKWTVKVDKNTGKKKWVRVK
jgi:hypothetical protein